MPRAKSANFTLRKIAVNVPAEKAAHRFAALQRSGQYSELRFIQRGKSAFDIVGYRWPDKGARRKYNIGRARKNPAAGRITSNQVLFGSRGKTLVGWINRETPTRYEITYKDGATTRTLWRRKDKVKFQATGRAGKLPKTPNRCPKQANPTTNGELIDAARLSEKFHGFKPRRISQANITWPRALVRIGACAQVDYVSDKFDGKLRQYYHEFEKACHVYAFPRPQADGSNALLIVGKFKIDKDGLIG